MEGKEAVNDAVNMAISENLLDGCFERQRSEVIGMILTEFDEEVFKQNVREDGYLEGLEAGSAQKAMEAAENLLKANIDSETIAKCIGLPLEQVLQIKEKLTVKA